MIKNYVIEYENENKVLTLTILAASYAALSNALMALDISGESILSIQIIG